MHIVFRLFSSRKVIGRFFILFIYLLLLFSHESFCQEAKYIWPLPEGWGKEIIPFPLKFAKQLNYQGVEEIHFAPEWRESGKKKNDWTYLFSWYLDMAIRFSTAMLISDLETYYNGLNRWVVQNSKRDPFPVPPARVSLEQVGFHPAIWHGQVSTTDVFSDLSPITLNLEVRQDSAMEGKSLLFFLLSQRKRTDRCWKELDDQQRSFQENNRKKGE